MTKKIHIALADDHTMVVEGLSSILDHETTFEVTQMATNGQELIELIIKAEKKPNVVLMDIEMPLLNGFATAEEIIRLFPDTKIIYLTGYISKFHIKKAIQTHANAYLLKDSDSETLIQAIKDVSTKGIHQNDYFNFNIIKEVIGRKPGIHGVGELTPKEKEFIGLFCLDKNLNEIAAEMGLTLETVRTYRKRIMHKIGVKKSTSIILFAFNNKLF